MDRPLLDEIAKRNRTRGRLASSRRAMRTPVGDVTEMQRRREVPPTVPAPMAILIVDDDEDIAHRNHHRAARAERRRDRWQATFSSPGVNDGLEYTAKSD